MSFNHLPFKNMVSFLQNITIKTLLFGIFIFSLMTVTVAQKQVYIPNYLKDTFNVDGAQFSMDKTHQTDNFILIWGNGVGTNPKTASDPEIRFDPVAVLDTMEFIYTRFKELGFMDDSPGTNLSKYKVVIVMYGTWGPDGAQGFANGGDADGVIGAFWVHPNGIRDGGVAAHEFAHSMQSQNTIDYRLPNGLGGSWYNAGIFWETHANYMRNLIYPRAVGAWGMDLYHIETWGDWKNTYENYALPMAISLSEGPEMVSRLWRESYSEEYPLQTYKRINNYSQSRFNDSLYQYARRMATYDFPYNNLGKYFRASRNYELIGNLPLIQNTFNILKKVGNEGNRYEMPIEQAPEEYGYNIIPLYPQPDSCAIIVKFKGHTEVNDHAGWRYGFVAENATSTKVRYSKTYKDDESEIIFNLEGDETNVYLVVMGAPWDNITTNTGNDTWKGYPKHFRFPYELVINGATPEGHQDKSSFRNQLKGNGSYHTNGGGWVESSALVDPSVFVGPQAIVLGSSVLTDNVKILGTSIVRDVVMKDNAIVKDNACVIGGSYSENCVIQGNAYVENAKISGKANITHRCRVYNYVLSGTVEVGGDVIVYNENGACDNGVHYTLTNYYDNKLLECDGRDKNFPTNKDVNNTYTTFTNEQMSTKCNCGNILTCNQTSSTKDNDANKMAVFPNPTSGLIHIEFKESLDLSNANIDMFDNVGSKVFTHRNINGPSLILDVSMLNSGSYIVQFTTKNNEIYRSLLSIIK